MIETQPNTPSQCPHGVRRWLMTGVLAAAGFLTGCSEPPADAVQTLASPAGPGSAEPHLSRGSDGTVVLSWLEPDGDAVALRYSVLAGDAWRPAQTVARGEDWFVNWADFPSVTPITDGLWAAHWLAKRPGGTYAYDVAIAMSTDGGRSWGEPITPHTDNTRTEHGFVSLFPWRDGVGALWLDGRNTMGEGHNSDSGDHAGGGMTLRSAVLRPNQEVPEGELIDELVCDCCQTDIAITDTGPVAVYRNRTRQEIRDIYVARNVDGQWLPEKAVADDGWEISGCPVNGPAVAAHGANVAVAWFTAANESSRVQLARSTDGGTSFTTPIDIDIQRPIGRVDIEWLDGGDTVVSWLRQGSDGQGELAIRVVTAAGKLGDAQVVATMSTVRLSGFPQMTRDGDRLIFAWTDVSNEESNLKTAELPSRSAIDMVPR